MNFFIKGDSRPIIGKSVYLLMYTKTAKDQEKKKVQLYVNEKEDNHKEVDGDKIVKQHWTLLKNGKLFLDLGNDGRVTFSQASLGINYTMVVTFTDIHGAKDTAKLNITPVAGTPSIENLKWQDQYYRDLNGKAIGYSDNVRLFIHTLNIPAGDRLQVTIWEDEGTDGHANSSRNMGTYTTSPVDKYGKAELYFNNIKAYQKILNDKDFRDENEHEFYAQVKYIGKIDTIQDTIQLKIINDLKKTVEPPKNNSLAKVAAPDKQKKPANKVGVKVTVNVFFDGTKNNTQNTTDRLAFQKEKESKTFSKDAKAYINNAGKESSYHNYYSNVSILNQINLVTTDGGYREIKIYIEGPGTVDNEKDDFMGYAYGSGDTSGIPIKVNKAFIEIEKEIELLKKKKLIKENEFVNEIELTVFGFSRGAAAARNFVSQRRKLQNLYDLESSKFTIKFVGLFDTVSSYSKNASLSPNFDNDVEGKQGLGLKMEGNIRKVVHLTAADEYRNNFSLTNIKSSILAGVGYELSLPGVHSDIGGGYEEDQKIEDRSLSSNISLFTKIKKELIKEGWYTQEQFVEVETNKDDSTDHFEFELHGIRKNIPNSYQFIPLLIMVQLAENYGLKFEKKLMEKGLDYSVPEDLTGVKNSLLNYAIANDGAHSKAISFKIEKLLSIRNKYLHRSASTSIGMEGRYKDGKPNRKIIDG
ncbi:phospholipase effector Tle1 domain-containing protein [Flavobacterium sp. FlaQc-48]|uniref:phospholipase effector Tle1 domain-containing protein n=1 Tax=Flavobacterium sp. FlaQc-48 TaxID=3374181 RepID=UPI003756F2DD